MKRELRSTVALVEQRGTVGRIVGTIIEEGRVASDRREVFTNGSVKFPHEGVQLLRGHGGDEVLTFIPKHEGSEIRIDEPLPDTILGRKIRAEVKSGARKFSVGGISLPRRGHGLERPRGSKRTC